MHPDVRQDKEGMCPDCGMKLVLAEEKEGVKHGEHKGHKEHKEFDKHQGHKTNVFKTKFWISLILSVPVVLYSSIVQTLLNWQPPQFPGSDYVPLILASVIFFYGGWVFIISAYRELRAKMPGMMTLISLAILTAYLYSAYVVIFKAGRDLLWELSTLIVVMLLGHWIEMRAVSGAQSALKELSKLLPDKAEVIRGDKTEIISLEKIKVGEVVLVKPGSKIPTDGIVIEGQSEVDESLATGESKPVSKNKNSEVIAGTVNGDGSLKVKVTKIGEDTFLSGVIRLVREAQASKSHLQILSDRAAFYLTIIAVVVGAVTFAVWLAVAEPSFAIRRMVAVLVITCPHALGLAIPLVASISTTMAAKNGFLIKQRLALEAARNIDMVLFDKTGTLTQGEFGIDTIVPFQATDEEVLRLAASININSEHPIAKAIVKEAQEKRVRLQKITDFQRIAGRGAKGKIDGKEYIIGSPSLLAEFGHKLEQKFKSKVEKLSQQGKTVVFVLTKDKIKGAIALADVIRSESYQAVRNLRQMGIKTAMITGDSDDVAGWVAEELSIDQYFAKILPQEKTERVRDLQGQGFKVAMVGDGINDAPALTQADLGIAIGAGTNVAIESAGIILVRNDPRDIVKIIKLSQLTYGKMIQNLFWATGYNVIAIPLAAGVLYFKGILLQPALAAILMSLSTVIVAINALLLRKKEL